MAVESRWAGVTVDAGQRPSFDGYVRARGDGLLRLAWLITRNFEDAHDAVQDAFASLLPRWSGLPEGDRLEAYVSRSVVNSCLAQVRRRGRSRPVPDPTLLAHAPVADDPAAGIAETDRLWRLCGELPATQRAALVLRFYRDLSFAEVAETLGCPESTARSHVRRAVVSLRRRMEEGERDG